MTKHTFPRGQARRFVEKLAALRFDNVFNPYAETCPEHDEIDAAAIRRNNLECVLEAALDKGVESIWVARDLGYRGGRRTGLALTDDVHLAHHAAMFGIASLARATKGEPVAERTAAVVWQMLDAVNCPVFLWNIFPLHSHEPGEPMSNRKHTREEAATCRPFLDWLLENLQPRHVVAIGRDAQAALSDLGREVSHVRHPSYGGQKDFACKLAVLYDL